MASEDGPPGNALACGQAGGTPEDGSAEKLKDKKSVLLDRLLKEGHRFSFFQAVSILERVYGSVGVGRQGPPGKEGINFRSDVSLGFPSSDITTIEETEGMGERVFRVTTTFLGVCGSVSPLPIFYTEKLITSDDANEQVRDFLDIFHHRLISFFYRCWTKYRYYIQFEAGGCDAFSSRIYSLIGLGDHKEAEGLGLPPARLLKYTGLLAMRPRSAHAIERIVSDFFGGITVRVEQCIGRWVKLPDDAVCTLGKKNSALGATFYPGENIFDRTGKFRLHITVPTVEKFYDFLPGGKNHKELYCLVDFCITDSLDFDVMLKIDAYEEFVLSSDTPSRLGWLAVLGDRAQQEATLLV